MSDDRRRPCGACRAMVDPHRGCVHWNPQVAARRRRGQLYRDDESIYRLAISHHTREALRRCVESETGRHYPGPSRIEREPSQRLAAAGLLRSVKRGGAYEATDFGREVWRRVLEINPE